MSMSRSTIQRKTILDTLKSFNTHPSAETIYREIQKDYPAISKATVYRNLRQLSESGIITQVSVIDDAARYDGRVDLHYHFHCKKCGGVLDVEMDGVQGIEDVVRDMYGFQVDKHSIIFTGTCGDCAKDE
ncbi:MAG: transcriptional repressor [Defluviitaleaceae bacterium]|nr:transcriptional repressor [Defluviitaleaceae bacterium]